MCTFQVFIKNVALTSQMVLSSMRAVLEDMTVTSQTGNVTRKYSTQIETA